MTACHPAVEGTRYLVADLSVPCFDFKHTMSLVSGACVMILLGLGLPAFIWFKSGRLLEDKSKFGFLFSKFCFYVCVDHNAYEVLLLKLGTT